MLLSLLQFYGSNKLWAEEVNTANYLINRMYTTVSGERSTPHERLFRARPNLLHIKLFGALAYVHITKEKHEGKFGPRARKRIIVGFERGKSYRIDYLCSNAFSDSRDVQFDETTLGWPIPTPREENISLSGLFGENYDDN